MKRPLSVILILLLALSSLGAVDLIRPKVQLTPLADGVRVDFDLSGIPQEKWTEMLSDPTRFHEYGYGVSGQPGDAALPILTQLIPVSILGDVALVNVTREELILASTVLKASPAGHLDSDPVAPLTQDYDWTRATRSVSENVLMGEPVSLQGHRYIPLTIHPIILDDAVQTVKLSTRLSVEISGLTLSENVTLNEDGNIRSVATMDDRFAPRGRYLIITPPVFQTYIGFLAEWKRQMGYQVDVVSTTVAGNSASAIKTYIQNAWDDQDTRPDFLILVGDEDQGIPGHYIQNPEGTNLVTDHPYGLMEGDDSFPEIMVGRLSVDTVSELASFMSKIIAYEKSPYMDVTSWFRRALMISTNTGAASAQATKEWVAAKLMESGFNHVFTAYHPYQTTTNYISSPINQGVGFVNYRGFGMYSGWFGPDFTSSDIYSQISNGAKTPVITSVVCGGGNFAAWEDPCFGEVWTRIGSSSVPRGAVAFFGPSELYTHTQFNNVIDIGIYSGIFDQGISTLGEALWNGKYELWRNYHQNSYFPFGQTPEFYHHIYNLLGDPGMQLWTDVPEELTVGFPATRSTSDNSVAVTVADESGSMVANAYVALHNNDYSIGGYTDAQGAIVLPLQVDEIGILDLTVTGKNLHPYLGSITLVEDDRPLVMNEWTLEDDVLLTAGLTTNMSIEFYNRGETLSNITLLFSSNSPGIQITESLALPDLPANSTYTVDGPTITVDPEVAHGSPVDITMEVSHVDEFWFQTGHFLVQAPVLNISGVQLGAGQLMAGDSIELSLELSNGGGVASSAITLTPLSSDLYTIDAASLACPSVDIEGDPVLSDPFVIHLSDQIFPGESIELAFQCEQGGVIDTLTMDLSVGVLTEYAPSLADEYGYRMFDNMDLSYSQTRPYEWIEIDPAMGGSGTVLPMHDYYEEADASMTILLPFTVSYYGELYNQITVCTNGWAAFGETDVVDFHNRTIPSPIGPAAMLAPFWDDLITNVGYVVQASSPEDGTFTLEWNRVRHLANNTPLSFQIVLYDTQIHPTESGDTDIKFQYQNYSSQDVAANFNTIGIESPDSDMGILATYNNIYDPSLPVVGPGVALTFSSDRGERLPAAMASLSQTNLNFVMNPWSTARDSIVLTNAGESPLAYTFNVNAETVLIQPAPAAPVDPNRTKSSPDRPHLLTSNREGSDAYGYTWVASDEEGAPAYQWIDIESTEHHLDYEGDPDDGCSSAIPLGFEFPFYDDVYDHVYIGYNGTIGFVSAESPWNNGFLPSVSAPAAILAPFWEDMNSDNGLYGELFFWTNEFNQCVITYKDFPKWGTNVTYTFQVIMDTFGKIIYQYQTLDGPTSSATVGMQNAEQSIGLQILYNEETSFPEERAITIRRPLEWFTASGWSGMLAGGESAAFIVDVHTQDVEPGHYEAPLTLNTSADNLPQAQILLALDLVLGTPPPGDVNHDYRLDINDLIKMLDFILLIDDMNEDQFELADISADNAVDIIDVVLLLEEILGTE